MNVPIRLCSILAAVSGILPVLAQPILSVDFNLRTANAPANTQPGFSNFTMTAASGIQTTPSVRSFGPITITVANSGTPGYDDRNRNTPTDGGSFSNGALLRDFIFSRDNNGTSGLDITVAGLPPNSEYRFTIWSFDSSSPGNRVSDWSANGVVATNGYAFNGSVLPTSSLQYRFSFSATTDVSGTVVISARRNPASVDTANPPAAAFGVFLNGLQIDPPTAVPPAILANPAPVELYRGDRAVFTASSDGTTPLSFQWWKDGTNAVPDATSDTLIISNAVPSDAGQYSVVVSNVAGSATSAPAALVVRDVDAINTGLLAYWTLDDITDVVLDASTNGNTLWATNTDLGNLVNGPRLDQGLALNFNGTDEWLMRTNEPGGTLPAYAYPAYTVAMWVNGIGTNQSDRRVFSESSNTNNNPLMTIGTDNQGSNNIVDIFIRNNNGSNPLNHRKSSLVAFDGTWHHIAWVDNNGAGNVYVDGVQDTNSFSYTRGVLTPNIDAVAVVYRTNNAANFSGAIDDVAVWRRSLSADEIRFVMANGVTRPAPKITRIDLTNALVTLTVSPVDPNVSYGVDQAADLDGTPVQWQVVGDTAAFRDGDKLIFQLTRPPQSRFYRIVEHIVP